MIQNNIAVPMIYKCDKFCANDYLDYLSKTIIITRFIACIKYEYNMTYNFTV